MPVDTSTDPERLADELERIRAAMDCFVAHRSHEMYEGDCRSTISHVEFAERVGHRSVDLSAAASALRSQAERIRALQEEFTDESLNERQIARWIQFERSRPGECIGPAERYRAWAWHAESLRQFHERESHAKDGRIANQRNEITRLEAKVRALEAERDAAVLAEREACAVLCEEIGDRQQELERHKWAEMKADAQTGCRDAAAAIRARSSATETGGVEHG